MLHRLFIQNYAIISQLEISFADGLIIITGETGAGKSILMGALGLALGDRADLAQMRDKEKKTIIEATFKLTPSASLKQIFSEADIDLDDEVIIRREIQSGGKSRAFINDTPASLSQVQAVASMLVDLHQQFDTLELGNKNFQRLLLDARADALTLMDQYGVLYSRYSGLQKKIQALTQLLLKAQEEKEYKLFLLTELEDLNWSVGEGKLLEDELNILSHAEQIKSGIGKVSFSLSEGDLPLIPQFKSVVSQLQAVAPYHPLLPSLIGRLESSYVEIKDIHSELASLLDGLTVDEKKIEQLNERIALAQRISKKHGLLDLDQLVETRESLRVVIDQFEGSRDELIALEKEIESVQVAAVNLAQQLHEKRKKQVPVLEKSTKDLLTRVGMPNAVLKIDLKQVALSAAGIDEVSFLFDANKSGQFEPLQKVASGGELSRLMLVLKSLVAGSLETPTLIFDEIDSGISGEAAKQVGVLMDELSDVHQLIAITHQPQIAARADQHLYVFKHERDQTITTGIKVLEAEERVMAIAKMLSGEKPGESALATAREMMK
jgi:DNA repair protein RecN (Recombination protein N)